MKPKKMDPQSRYERGEITFDQRNKEYKDILIANGGRKRS